MDRAEMMDKLMAVAAVKAEAFVTDAIDTTIPADIPPELVDTVREIMTAAYTAGFVEAALIGMMASKAVIAADRAKRNATVAE